MNGADEDVRTMLVTASSDLPAGIDLLRGVRDRQAPARRRRARYRMPALISAGAVAVAGGGAVLAATLTATVASAPPALAAVTAAAAKTSAESFQATVDSGVGSQQLQFTGEFNPAQGIGEETGPGGIELIFTGQYMYLHLKKALPGTAGKAWVQLPELTGTVANPVKLLAGSLLTVARANPQTLLATLESAGTVTDEGPASGPGWTGTEYSFTSTVGPAGTVRGTVTGTVDVDRQGRVRELAATVTNQPPGGNEVTGIRADMTFGDFGVPVSVTPPPASEIYTVPVGSKGGPIGAPTGGLVSKAARVKIAALKSGG